VRRFHFRIWKMMEILWYCNEVITLSKMSW